MATVDGRTGACFRHQGKDSSVSNQPGYLIGGVIQVTEVYRLPFITDNAKRLKALEEENARLKLSCRPPLSQFDG